MIIKGKNFTLKPYRKSDEKELVKNLNDKKVSKFMCTVPFPYKIKDAKKFIRESKKHLKKKSKTTINFAIEIDGKIVGGIGFRDVQDNRAEIGYWLGRKYWDKGIMTNVVKSFTEFGFKKLEFIRIQAHVFVQNKNSARVLEKNGYKLEGRLRKFQMKDSKAADCLLYAKIK